LISQSRGLGDVYKRQALVVLASHAMILSNIAIYIFLGPLKKVQKA
jgi:hypothetical protein